MLNIVFVSTILYYVILQLKVDVHVNKIGRLGQLWFSLMTFTDTLSPVRGFFYQIHGTIIFFEFMKTIFLLGKCTWNTKSELRLFLPG